MAGVIQSSSNVSSSVSTDARIFDVGNDGEILQLLNFIRQGDLDDSHKIKLNGVVLDFVRARDVSLLSQIIPILKSKKVSLTQNGTIVEEVKENTETNPTPEKQSSVEQSEEDIFALGNSRPQPAFTAPTASVSTPQAVTKVPVKDVAQPETSKPQAEQKPVASPTPTPTTTLQTPPVPPVPKANPPQMSVPEVVPPVPPAPKAVPTPPPVAKSSIPQAVTPTPAQAPVTAPASVPSQTPTPTPTPAPIIPPTQAAPAPVDYMTRIKEIKRLVNEKVGNPVNLIDANNTVGREYMNSLLNAMKRVNGGTPDEVKLAMERLEKAFLTVEKSIQSGETVIGEKKIMPAATPSPKDETQEVLSEPATVVQQTVPTATPPAPAKVTPALMSTPTVQDLPKNPTPITEQPELTAPETPTPPPAPPEPIKSIPTPPKTEMQKIAEETKLSSDPVAPSSAQSVPSATNTTLQPNSLADTLQKENSERESLLTERAAELETQASKDSTDPLQSNEISAGLQQLLSEWKLFKSSGIFGTGANGYEHPLYKTISAVPMAAVIAGRFEGSTPEIKQSISDYMNGWRYEQNVVHEMNETFEHYLRRVIKEVLSRQNKIPTA